MSYNDDYLLPVVQPRNIADPRKFVTKWDIEINKKHLRKRAIRNNRDSKFRDFHDDNYDDIEAQKQNYEQPEQDQPYIIHIYVDPLVKSERSEFIHINDTYYVQLPIRFIDLWPPTAQEYIYATSRRTQHAVNYCIDWLSWVARYARTADDRLPRFA